MKSGGDKGIITEACYMYVCCSLHWPAVPTCLDLPALREVGPKECDPIKCSHVQHPAVQAPSAGARLERSTLLRRDRQDLLFRRKYKRADAA